MYKSCENIFFHKLYLIFEITILCRPKQIEIAHHMTYLLMTFFTTYILIFDNQLISTLQRIYNQIWSYCNNVRTKQGDTNLVCSSLSKIIY